MVRHQPIPPSPRPRLGRMSDQKIPVDKPVLLRHKQRLPPIPPMGDVIGCPKLHKPSEASHAEDSMRANAGSREAEIGDGSKEKRFLSPVFQGPWIASQLKCGPSFQTPSSELSLQETPRLVVILYIACFVTTFIAMKTQPFAPNGLLHRMPFMSRSMVGVQCLKERLPTDQSSLERRNTVLVAQVLKVLP